MTSQIPVLIGNRNRDSGPEFYFSKTNRVGYHMKENCKTVQKCTTLLPLLLLTWLEEPNLGPKLPTNQNAQPKCFASTVLVRLFGKHVHER